MDITKQFNQRLTYSQQQSVSQQKPQIQVLLQVLQDQLQHLHIIIDAKQHEYTGNILLNGMHTMTLQECQTFEQQIFTQVSSVKSQIQRLLSSIDSQLSQSNQSLDDQITGLIALQNSYQLLQFYAGAGGVVLRQADNVLIRMNELARERKNFVQSYNLEAVLWRQRPQKLDVSHAVNAVAEEPVPSPQFWDETKEQLLNADLNEYVLAQRTLRSAQEIAEMQAMSAEKIQEQSEIVDRIADLAVSAEGNMTRASKFLGRAKKNLEESTKTTVVLLLLSIFGIWYLDKFK